MSNYPGRHSLQTQNHRIESWIYVSSAERLAATGFTIDDVGRIAYQQSDNSYWRLNNTAPVTWAAVVSSVGMTNPMTTQGDMIVGDVAASPSRLAKGTDGQVLTTDPTTHLPKWSAPAPSLDTTAGDNRYAQRSSNLSDLSSIPTARTSLGLGTAATHDNTDYAAASHTHSESQVTNLITDLAAKAPVASPTFTGTPTAPVWTASGLTGAVAASRYVGGTASVAPTTGTFLLGDFVVTQSGRIYICTTAGSPGTWTLVGGIEKLFGWYDEVVPTATSLGPSYPITADLTLVRSEGWAEVVATGSAAQHDIQYKRGAGAWTSVFSVLPQFAVGANQRTAGTLSVTTLNAGDFIRRRWVGTPATIADVSVYLVGVLR